MITAIWVVVSLLLLWLFRVVKRHDRHLDDLEYDDAARTKEIKTVNDKAAVLIAHLDAVVARLDRLEVTVHGKITDDGTGQAVLEGGLTHQTVTSSEKVDKLALIVDGLRKRSDRIAEALTGEKSD